MLIYVIPFILLLIVAGILKHRESKAGNDTNEQANKSKSKNRATPPPKKANAKVNPAVKKDVSSSRESDSVTVTAVAPELLQKLQQLIHGGHFNSAEAHINQSLNRDPNQHELYLLLLKVHLLQKDDLAVNQLINHIRSLQVPELLAEAETKRSEQAQLQRIENDFLTETNSDKTPTPNLENPFQSLTLAKDDATSLSVSNTDNATTLTKETQTNNTLPDFNFDSFNFSDLTTEQQTQGITQSENVTIIPNISADNSSAKYHNSATALDHNASLAAENSVADDAPLKFSFNLTESTIGSPPVSTSELVTSTESMSFDIDFASDNSNTTAQSLNLLTPNEPDLNSTNLLLTDDQTQIDIASVDDAEASKTEDSLEFDLANFSFSLDPDKAVNAPDDKSTVTSTLKSDALDFNVDAEQSEPITAENLSFAGTAEDTQATIIEDALLQQFPELKHLNTNQLDIDLAQLYVDYAASDAAHSLLDTLTSKMLTPEQRQQLQLLQEKLASDT